MSVDKRAFIPTFVSCCDCISRTSQGEIGCLVIVPAAGMTHAMSGIGEAFLDVYGNHFRYPHQQVKDVRLTGKLPNGQPVDLTMDPVRSGLDGLADVGVFKGKRKS